jgi:SAM-dependent methyltransferase
MKQDPHVYVRELASDRWPWNQGSLVRLARWVPQCATVLELGPASGYFTRHLSQALGCVVDAIELDPAMADNVRPWCRHLVVGDLETLDIAKAVGENAYRAIIVADVLEHLRDPGRLLIALRKLLAPEGQILISVPNVAYVGLVADLAAGEFVYRDEGLLDRTHLRFFTRDSLQALLHDAGLHPWAWSAVELPLHESEFNARVETLPRALREALTASPHAFCYQWLVAAGASAPATPPAEVPACQRDRFPVRVFWMEPGSGWNYERSVVAWGEVGAERQIVRIPLPRLGRAALRVCLADRPAFVRVHSVRLASPDDATGWSWQAADGAARLARAIHNVGLGADRECCHATLYDVESWLELDCPDVDFPEGGGALELELGWPMSPDFLAARQGWLAATGALQTEVERLTAMLAERDVAPGQRAAQAARREEMPVPVPDTGAAPPQAASALAGAAPSATAPAEATASSALAARAARVALRWRHTPAGRVLCRLTPPAIVAALKARLR